MKFFTKKQDLKAYISSKKAKNKTIGFVPTMGALHKGHLSLIKKAKKKNDIVVVSIFVNPTQFDKQEDLVKYPKTLENDTLLLEKVACDVLFNPSVEEIYNTNVTAENFDFDGLEHQMEGKFRDGHFNGVGTIVKTLFEIITPVKAYFGEKDFQQLATIRRLVLDLDMPVRIIGAPISRDEHGLALSSRNNYFDEKGLGIARQLNKIMFASARRLRMGHDISLVVEEAKAQILDAGFDSIDYVSVAHPDSLQLVETPQVPSAARLLMAAHCKGVRLIDNCAV